MEVFLDWCSDLGGSTRTQMVTVNAEQEERRYNHSHDSDSVANPIKRFILRTAWPQDVATRTHFAMKADASGWETIARKPLSSGSLFPAQSTATINQDCIEQSQDMKT